MIHLALAPLNRQRTINPSVMLGLQGWACCVHTSPELTLIGSRALAAYGDVDGPSAANNHPWSRKCTARLLRRSDTSSSAHGCAGTRSVRLGGAGNVG